MNRYSRDAARA
jgi:SnoaL-like domain